MGLLWLNEMGELKALQTLLRKRSARSRFRVSRTRIFDRQTAEFRRRLATSASRHCPPAADASVDGIDGRYDDIEETQPLKIGIVEVNGVRGLPIDTGDRTAHSKEPAYCPASSTRPRGGFPARCTGCPRKGSQWPPRGSYVVNDSATIFWHSARMPADHTFTFTKPALPTISNLFTAQLPPRQQLLRIALVWAAGLVLLGIDALTG